MPRIFTHRLCRKGLSGCTAFMEILGVICDVQRKHNMSQQPHYKPELKEFPDFRARDLYSCFQVSEFAPWLTVRDAVIQWRATAKQHGRVQHWHRNHEMWFTQCASTSQQIFVNMFSSHTPWTDISLFLPTLQADISLFCPYSKASKRGHDHNALGLELS